MLALADAFVFTTESGRPIWRGNLNKLIAWKAAVAQIGQPHLHFHDLRHTGNTLAAKDRSEHPRSDGPDGPRLIPGRVDLPARHR
ncbi:hypothetical protein ACGFLU_09875 [Micromonospora chersina]|uniref:hypothetical protein n=1 Tax=Micromonospora chersina TaxID=47854 RepID=UPI00371ABCBD